MVPIDVAEKRKILRRVMASGLPIKVLPTNGGQLLIDLGVTEVYIREMSVIKPGHYTFMVNPDPVSNLSDTYQVTDEDLDLSPYVEGGGAAV